MRKVILSILIMSVLLATAGCNSREKKLYLPEAKNDKTYAVIGGADEPTDIKVTDNKNNRADEVNLTVMVEGEKEPMLSKLYTGEGYSVYIPKEGYRFEKDFDDGAVEEKWESTINDDVEFTVSTYKNTDAEKAQSRFLRDNDDYIFEDLLGYPLCGIEPDGDRLWFELHESGGNIYIVSWKYPKNAEEGFGSRLSAIAESFELSNKEKDAK